MVSNRTIPSSDELTQREESMTTIKAMRLASLVTAINVLVASGFSIAAIIRPQYLVPAAVPTEASLLLAMYAAAPRIPLALLVLGAIYKQATSALLILGALAGAMQLLDAGIGLYELDPGKCAGPLFIAVLQFFVVHLLRKSVQITPQTKRG
jgi:FlaA1/EpsC-like NDP-sugar epimerase